MFYNDIKLNYDSDMNQEFQFINNFFDKLPVVVENLTKQLFENSFEIFEENNFYYNDYNSKIKEIVNEQLKLIINAKRLFSLETRFHSENVIKKLDDNGLVGDSLRMKLQLLDFLWFKIKDLLMDLRGGLHFNIVNAFIDLLKAILNSVLNAIGFNQDIFNEAFSVVNALVALSNNEYHKN